MNIQTLYQNKTYQFWTLQIAGFAGYGITFYLERVVQNIPVANNYALYVSIKCVIGLLLTLGLRATYRAMWDSNIGLRVFGLVVASYLAAVIWMAARSALYGLVFKPSEGLPSMSEFLYLTSSVWWVMAVWSGLYVGIKYYLLFQDERQQSLKVAAMAHEAQLKMLRYQLNPHFLFNTLNAISTLILVKDNELAGTMLTRLSRFLRYSLENDPIQKVSLDQEIEALKLYLDIEKVRFDDRLRVEFELDEKSAKAQVPSLLLQPLVENAIKYAVAQSTNGGLIKITARVFANDLLLEVIDDGPGIQSNDDNKNANSEKGTGVGLSNIENRLRELYAENQSFRSVANLPSGLKVSIRIPFETS